MACLCSDRDTMSRCVLRCHLNPSNIITFTSMAASRRCSITRTTVAIVCVTTSSHTTHPKSKNDPLPHGSCFAHTMPSVHPRRRRKSPGHPTERWNVGHKHRSKASCRNSSTYENQTSTKRTRWMRQAHPPPRRKLAPSSATDAFAMQSNPSNCSWCNTQKLEFCIHCCSTCHALPRSHMNLGIEAHTLFTHAFGCARPFKHRTRHHTRSSAHPVLLQQCSKLLEPMCQGSVSPARLG